MPQAYSLLLELNQHTYLPAVNAEFDICVISCGKEWWRFRLVDVKSDERQEGMVARTAYRLNQSMGTSERLRENNFFSARKNRVVVSSVK